MMPLWGRHMILQDGRLPADFFTKSHPNEHSSACDSGLSCCSQKLVGQKRLKVQSRTYQEKCLFEYGSCTGQTWIGASKGYSCSKQARAVQWHQAIITLRPPPLPVKDTNPSPPWLRASEGAGSSNELSSWISLWHSQNIPLGGQTGDWRRHSHIAWPSQNLY